MEKYYLIVDLGTGNSRVGLVSSRGEILSIRSFENNYYRDENYEDAQYFLPEEWLIKLLEHVKKITEDHPDKKISAITSLAARQTIVLYDKNGIAFYGLPNIDNRGEAWVKEIKNSKQVYKLSGRWLTCDFPAAKLLGFKMKYNDLYNRIYKISSLSEWVGEIFTGQISIEPSQACETQLYNIDTNEWSKELCSYFGIREDILPTIIQSGSVLGNIRLNICEELSIDRDCVFIVGGADTQVAVKAIGIKEGDTAIVSGTTSPIVKILKDRYYDELERCWTDCNLKGINYQIETNPGVTGLNYQRFKNLFFSDTSYEHIDDVLSKKEEYKCVASFTTLFFDEAKSVRKGGFTMRPPFYADCDRYDFMWSVAADIACAIYEQYKNLDTLIRNNNEYILGCGGGFQSAFISQMISDLTNKEVHLRKGYSQASLMGGTVICNDYFGIELEKSYCVDKVYYPSENNLIMKYYKEWYDIRVKMNS